jgi:hypothetical protein
MRAPTHDIQPATKEHVLYVSRNPVHENYELKLHLPSDNSLRTVRDKISRMSVIYPPVDWYFYFTLKVMLAVLNMTDVNSLILLSFVVCILMALRHV